MASVTIRAFAKINLSLRVSDRQPDGFHNVQTILQGIDLSDRLIGESRRGPFEIVCVAPGVPADRTNLVWKAAQRLWDAAGREGQPRDVRVTIEKRIPTRAGLGGGSSDAAAALFALRRLWKLKVEDGALHAIARRLGSDVPYFFVGGTALGLGRGDEVYPLEDLPRLWTVLILPPFGIGTADAYQWLDAMRAREKKRPGAFFAETAKKAPGPFLSTWLGRVAPLVNDLERPVIERHPVVGTLRDRLIKMGAAMAAMSGSGSTVFGVFTTARAAQAAAKTLQQSGAVVLCTRFVSRQKR